MLVILSVEYESKLSDHRKLLLAHAHASRYMAEVVPCTTALVVVVGTGKLVGKRTAVAAGEGRIVVVAAAAVVVEDEGVTVVDCILVQQSYTLL